MAQGAKTPLCWVSCMRTSPTLLNLEEHKLLPTDIKEIGLRPKADTINELFPPMDASQDVILDFGNILTFNSLFPLCTSEGGSATLILHMEGT